MPDYLNPMSGTYTTQYFADLAAQAKKNQQNWITDPEAPWNTWAADLEGYLKDWVSSQREGLQADLSAKTAASAQQAIGQGLYTGTYTTSLPAEQLAKMTAQHTQNYAGAMSNIQSQALAQLMQGKQQYGQQMLDSAWRDLMLKAQAEQANKEGWSSFLGSLFKPLEIIPWI